MANESTIIQGRDFSPLATDHHSNTGSIGRTQGATMVSIHAQNDKRRSHIEISNK